MLNSIKSVLTYHLWRCKNLVTDRFFFFLPIYYYHLSCLAQDITKKKYINTTWKKICHIVIWKMLLMIKYFTKLFYSCKKEFVNLLDFSTD